jgi:hypothetical protein
MKASRKLGVAVAVANFFVWGLGYIILGKRRLFGVLALVAFALNYARRYIPTQATFVIDLGYWVFIASYYLLSLAFAIDAYQLGSSEEKVSPSGSS